MKYSVIFFLNIFQERGYLISCRNRFISLNVFSPFNYYYMISIGRQEAVTWHRWHTNFCGVSLKESVMPTKWKQLSILRSKFVHANWSNPYYEILLKINGKKRKDIGLHCLPETESNNRLPRFAFLKKELWFKWLLQNIGPSHKVKNKFLYYKVRQ